MWLLHESAVRLAVYAATAVEIFLSFFAEKQYTTMVDEEQLPNSPPTTNRGAA